MQDSAPSVDSSGDKPLSHKKAWDNSDRPALGTRPSVSQILRESLQEEGNLPK